MLGRGRDIKRESTEQIQIDGSSYSGPLLDLSNDNCTTGGQQFVISSQQYQAGITGSGEPAIGICEFTTKEENESYSSSIAASPIGQEEAADIDESWLSDLMILNAATGTNNNLDKQAVVVKENNIFTPDCHGMMSVGHPDEELLEKYLEQQTLHQQQSVSTPMIENEEFDSYFNELFPDLAI